MLGKNVTTDELKTSAEYAMVKMAYEPYATPKGIRFRLAPLTDHKRNPHHRFPFHRKSASCFRPERRVSAVCWHGHRDYFRVLFSIAPKARIYTALIQRAGLKITHWNKENFEENFEATGAVNIGAPIMPVRADEACFCDEDSSFQYMEATPDLSKVEVIKVNQHHLTGECWLIQFKGEVACETCSARDTDECGGKEIRKTLKNSKGWEVPLGSYGA